MSLRIHPLPALAALVVIAIGIAAGNWQSGRAREKLDLQARLEAARGEAPVAIGTDVVDAQSLHLHPARARGRWLAEHTILVDNRVHEGVVGYYVVTPLRLEGSDRCLVVYRGWIAGTGDRARLPEVPMPGGTVEVEGEARVPKPKVFELSDQSPAGRVWQNVLLERYGEWSGLPLQPAVLMQTSSADDGLVRDWPRPDLGIDMHRGYALQWYSLAALTAVIFVALALKRDKQNEAEC